jgi:hypothetical protein
MEDILAIVLIFGGGTAVAISFSPIGRAIAERLRGRAFEETPSEDLLELRDHVTALQQQVSELAERQDFAERLLAQARDKGALGAGGPAV